MNVGKTTIRNNEIRNNAPVPLTTSTTYHVTCREEGQHTQTNTNARPYVIILNNSYWLIGTFHHGPNIYKDTKPLMSAFLKNWPVKVLGGRCLPFWGPRSPPLSPVTRCMNTYNILHTPVLMHTGRGGGVGEPVRRLEERKGSKIPTWLTVSPVY